MTYDEGWFLAKRAGSCGTQEWKFPAYAVKHCLKHLRCVVGSSGALDDSSRGRQQKVERKMALFMDVHTLEGGVAAKDVAEAHQADLGIQAAYGVNYLRYWVDEEAGKIFCLVDAPDAASAGRVHREAHGLVADEIYRVSEKF